jgi:hypothetical protein
MPDATGFASEQEKAAAVQRDKAAADLAQIIESGVLAEDLEDLRTLRREKAEREAREAQARAEAAERLSKPTHYMQLADGQLLEGSHLGTRHTTGDGTGDPHGDSSIAVVGAYPMS